jgi:NAD(P)H dehydrogenase (quinone)
VRQDIVHKGQIDLPFGHGRHVPVAAEDQVRVIVAILANPVSHSGSTYRLCGPVEMDEHGVAKAVGEAHGREVIYKPIGIADFRRQLEPFGLPEQTIQNLCPVAFGTGVMTLVGATGDIAIDSCSTFSTFVSRKSAARRKGRA